MLLGYNLLTLHIFDIGREIDYLQPFLLSIMTALAVLVYRRAEQPHSSVQPTMSVYAS
jgi:hypothetical protein